MSDSEEMEYGPDLVESYIKEILSDIRFRKEEVVARLNWRQLGLIAPPESKLYDEGRLHAIEWIEERIEETFLVFLYAFSPGKLDLYAAGGLGFSLAKGLCKRYVNFIEDAGGDISSMDDCDIFGLAEGIIQTILETTAWYRQEYGDPRRVYLPHFISCAVEGYIHGYLSHDEAKP